MFSASLSTPSHMGPALHAEAGDPSLSASALSIGLHGVANQGDASPAEAPVLPFDGVTEVSETQGYDMKALLTWVGKASPGERRYDAALRISYYVHIASDSALVLYGPQMAHIDLRGLGLAELPPLPAEAMYVDDSENILKQASREGTAGFPLCHAGHPGHPRHNLYADIFREIGYAGLHLHPLLESTAERESLADALAQRWVGTNLSCDRVGVEKDNLTVMAWNNKNPADGVQARVKLPFVEVKANL